jgi:hypothetical protein
MVAASKNWILFPLAHPYDVNGNTTGSGGINYVYDFENRLVQKGGLTIVYDGDGNRKSKTVGGVTTTYLVDDLNPTGYAVQTHNPRPSPAFGESPGTHL